MYSLTHSAHNCSILTIFTGKKLCFTHFGTRMAALQLLIFSICLHNQLSYIQSISQLAFTCVKAPIETLEKGVKYVQIYR